MGTIVDWERSFASMEHETWDMDGNHSERVGLEAGEYWEAKQKNHAAEACMLKSHAL
jgi:hypothetical protein